MEDLAAMMADAGITMEGHIVTADYATRNLLDELDAARPYIITHANYRHQVEARQREMLAAFDAMAVRS